MKFIKIDLVFILSITFSILITLIIIFLPVPDFIKSIYQFIWLSTVKVGSFVLPHKLNLEYDPVGHPILHIVGIANCFIFTFIVLYPILFFWRKSIT